MLQVAYLSGNSVKNKPLTAKQLLHQEALAAVASRKIRDRQNADKLFAQEIQELEDLQKHLDHLKN